MRKTGLIMVVIGLMLFISSYAAHAISIPAGPVTFHWTDWEARVTDVGDNLEGVFRLDQMLDESSNVVWSHGDGGEELTGQFQNLNTYQFDGENPGDRILFNGGDMQVYLGTAGNFDPTAPGSNVDWVPGKLWLDVDFVSGRDMTAPNATLASMITSWGTDPEGVAAILGMGRGLLDVVGGAAGGIFDTNTFDRLDGGGNVIGLADMSLDANFFIRNTGSSPYTNQKDGHDVWSKDPIGANAIPEPATMLLLGSGLIGLAGFGRKKKFFKKD